MLFILAFSAAKTPLLFEKLSLCIFGAYNASWFDCYVRINAIIIDTSNGGLYEDL
ncbi:hypothetical protein KDK_40930 [Dictyobacter kobayashii]|uniref:Uncharacterized protein n=1 Tax=Dictyobacter kobayashii TaxID=2014872 RepID=A0A402AME4_9CHLR|nr:hypothetical protein KDK_40930 [Dictyobacter kobayashii]